MEYEIKDPSLKDIGREKIEWIKDFMPVLSSFEKNYKNEQPLKGIKVSMALHLEAKTAYLAIVMNNLGAQVRVTGSNPLSTQDEITAALVDMGISVFAYRGVDSETYKRHLVMALSHKPNIVIDDGADLAHTMHKEHPELMEEVYGGCEETTTGIVRLKAMDKQKVMKYPMFAINDADCKHLFDNRYGTGQSSLEGIMRATNLTLFGKKVVIAGYGWCGKGIASKAKGFGANVVVTEVDSVKALEAVMDGFDVMPMEKASKIGDIFITVTGDIDVITSKHFSLMKNNAILCNAGHFDCEISMKELNKIAIKQEKRRNGVTGYHLNNGNVINVLGEGRLVNLACADGHAAEIMDMSFSLQLLTAFHILENKGKLENRLYDVPSQIDKAVADAKLKSMGISIDILSKEQKKYLESWE
ncbi:MAG: adenosylhomocysteinase [Clostridia bacterium]|jgi:adenosylhomocysteinase